METVRVLFAIATHMKWTMYHFDVKSAFLNNEILEEVYIKQIAGYVTQGSEEKVFKLRKLLYGLR